MVLNRGGFNNPSCVHNETFDVHHEHPVLCRSFRTPVSEITEVKYSTKEGHKQVNTTSWVFVLKFILGINIPSYIYQILHYPIIIMLSIWVS